MNEPNPSCKWVITGPLTASLYDHEGKELGGVSLFPDSTACESWVWVTVKGERQKALLNYCYGGKSVSNACELLESGFPGMIFSTRPTRSGKELRLTN